LHSSKRKRTSQVQLTGQPLVLRHGEKQTRRYVFLVYLYILGLVVTMVRLKLEVKFCI